MKSFIQFDSLRLTCDPDNNLDENICLKTRQKYVPVLKVYKMKFTASGEFQRQDPIKFPFEEAAFVAVSFYLNEKMKEIKIGMNKYSTRFSKTSKRCHEVDGETGESSEKRCKDDLESGLLVKMLTGKPCQRSPTTVPFSMVAAPNSTPGVGAKMGVPKLLESKTTAMKTSQTHVKMNRFSVSSILSATENSIQIIPHPSQMTALQNTSHLPTTSIVASSQAFNSTASNMNGADLNQQGTAPTPSMPMTNFNLYNQLLSSHLTALTSIHQTPLALAVGNSGQFLGNPGIFPFTPQLYYPPLQFPYPIQPPTSNQENQHPGTDGDKEETD